MERSEVMMSGELPNCSKLWLADTEGLQFWEEYWYGDKPVTSNISQESNMTKEVKVTEKHREKGEVT